MVFLTLGLHLLSQVLVQHLLEAMFDDVVSSIEGDTTATFLPTSVGCCHRLYLPLRIVKVCRVDVEGGLLISIHVNRSEDCFLVLI